MEVCSPHLQTARDHLCTVHPVVHGQLSCQSSVQHTRWWTEHIVPTVLESHRHLDATFQTLCWTTNSKHSNSQLTLTHTLNYKTTDIEEEWDKWIIVPGWDYCLDFRQWFDVAGNKDDIQLVTRLAASTPKTPFTRYNQLSNRLYNRFDNWLYRVYKHFTQLSKRFDNRFANRLYCVNGA